MKISKNLIIPNKYRLDVACCELLFQHRKKLLKYNILEINEMGHGYFGQMDPNLVKKVKS